MNLIINADDFGLTKDINMAVSELFELGTITSTSVMVNMPYAKDIENFLDLKKFGIGLHFNLTQGKPISKPSEIGSVIDEFGNFFTVQELKNRIKKRKVFRAHVLKEIRAQYDWLFEIVGERLTHIDSHQDINKIKFISDVLLEFSHGLNYKHGLRAYNKSYLSVSCGKYKIENPNLLFPPGFGLRRRLVESYFRFRNRTLSKRYTLPAGMLMTKDNSTRGLLKRLLIVNSNNCEKKCYEIMCHPSKSVEGLFETQMLKSRVEEYEILKSEAFQSFTKIFKLINFSEIYVI